MAWMVIIHIILYCFLLIVFNNHKFLESMNWSYSSCAMSTVTHRTLSLQWEFKYLVENFITNTLKYSTLRNICE